MINLSSRVLAPAAALALSATMFTACGDKADPITRTGQAGKAMGVDAPGIEEVAVDSHTGAPVPPGTRGAIMEAFKAGTAPGEAPNDSNIPDQPGTAPGAPASGEAGDVAGGIY